MANHEPPEDPTSHRSRTYSLASDIIQAAIADASRIRLDAVKSGEQMYEEIVNSARARAGEILAEAKEEAQRIKAAAEIRASQQAGGTHDSHPAEAALEALRVELAAMVRQLRGSLDDDSADSYVQGLASEPLAPDRAVTGREAATPLGSHGLNGTYVPQTPARPSHNGSGRKQDDPEHPHRQDDGFWKPPEWMSS